MPTYTSSKPVANWIFIGVAMLMVQVLLGGITRLTGSGLSITEWQPIMGALPPMNEAEWQKAFNAYRQIAQFKFLNQHFTLSNFKFIFFWEWFHRLWARLIGVVFIIPFIYFLLKGYFKKGMVVPLIILFLLGALQGAIGWLMVQSGLNDTDVYVSHIRLACHFIAAMLLICYALVFGLKLSLHRSSIVYNRRGFYNGLFITFLVFIQLILGAFMAGLKAANAAPTWPEINGEFIPTEIFLGSISHNVLYNKITVHFMHRSLAYVIGLSIFFWWFTLRSIKISSAFNTIKNWPIVIVIIQIVLGILTVLNSTTKGDGSFGWFEWFAQLHQLTGMLLLLNLVSALYMLKGSSKGM